MENITIIATLGIICLFIPMRFLIVFSIVGVLLADTNFIPRDYIYLSRFVPLGILFFRGILKFTTKRSSLLVKPGLVKDWIPFIVLSLVSIAYSIDPLLSVQRLVSALFAIFGFSMVISLYFNDERRLLNLLKLIGSVMGIVILYSLFSLPSQGQMAMNMGEHERFRGVFTNPNTLGFVSMEAFFVIWYLLHKERQRMKRYLLFASLVLTGSTIIMSGSRAAILGFIVGIMIYISFGSLKMEQKKKKWAVPFLLLISIALVIDNIFPEYLGGVFRMETTSRITLWERAWILSKDSPYFGVGFCASDKVFVEDAFYLRRIGIFIAGPHSSVMRLLVDLGFAGIILMVFAFASLMRRVVNYYKYFDDPDLGVLMLAVVIGGLVNSVFEDWLFGFGNSTTVPFWFFLSVLSYQCDKARAIARQRSFPGYAVKSDINPMHRK